MSGSASQARALNRSPYSDASPASCSGISACSDAPSGQCGSVASTATPAPASRSAAVRTLAATSVSTGNPSPSRGLNATRKPRRGPQPGLPTAGAGGLCGSAGSGAGDAVEDEADVLDRSVPSARSPSSRRPVPRNRSCGARARRSASCRRRRRAPQAGASSRRRRSQSAIGPSPAATALAAPPDDPPGVRARSHGLRVGPKSRLVVLPLHANSEAVRRAEKHRAGRTQASDRRLRPPARRTRRRASSPGTPAGPSPRGCP